MENKDENGGVDGVGGNTNWADNSDLIGDDGQFVYDIALIPIRNIH